MADVMESILKIFTLENILFLFEGVKISLLIAICSLLLGTIIGTLLASFRISKNVVLRIIGRVYVDLIRGTPMLLQLSFLYLGFPMVYQLITGEYLGMDALSVAPYVVFIHSFSVGRVPAEWKVSC